MEDNPIQRNALNMCYDRELPAAPTPPEMTQVERLVFITSKMWAPGDKLTVSFFGGTQAQIQHVMDAAARISQFANIDFEFITSGPGRLRIAFNPSLGAWSYSGRDALGITRSQPTMNLGFDQPGTYTHELMHALAAIHEHQSPFSNPIQWNKQQVYHDLGGPPNNWDTATIDHNMFAKYSQTITNGTTFDSKSVMLYSFPASWTVDGFHVNPNVVLSALDKSWLTEKYPGRTAPTPPTPPTPPVPPTPPTVGEFTATLRIDPATRKVIQI